MFSSYIVEQFAQKGPGVWTSCYSFMSVFIKEHDRREEFNTQLNYCIHPVEVSKFSIETVGELNSLFFAIVMSMNVKFGDLGASVQILH